MCPTLERDSLQDVFKPLFVSFPEIVDLLVFQVSIHLPATQ